MVRINTHLLLPKRDTLLLHTLPTIVAFLALMTVTFISWTTAKSTVVSEERKAVEQLNDDAVGTIKQHMDSYEDILRGGAGLFNGSENVSRTEWRNYLADYNISTRYPGIQGVGYISLVRPGDLAAHIQAVRDEGYPDYTVFPAGDRPIYTSVVYIEPFTDRNLKAFGLDMYVDPARQTAMDKARDSGEAVMSNIVTPITDDGTKPQPTGFLLFVPLYSQAPQPTTIAARRTSLRGFIYAPFRSNDFITKTLTAQNQNYGFQIYNLANKSRQLIFQSNNFNDIMAKGSTQQQTTEASLPGSTWQILGTVSPNIVSISLRNRTMATLVSGFLFSFFVAGFIYLLLANRARVLSQREEAGIQEAKDELLALASHQLRTPATGVKQYIGMLREGLAGKVTPTQQKLLDKAYESNERQLVTINEMLFVARSDAGHLKMEKAPVDLSQMIRDTAAEQSSAIKGRKQTYTIKVRKKPVIVQGDKQYLGMAFENILSNASKYTKEGGKITIALTNKKDVVSLVVRDNGVGVANEDQSLLFKKFSRIPNELSNQVSGSGIGLYLAKKVIDGHRGTIKFTSASHRGSQVTICLPKTDDSATNGKISKTVLPD